MTRFKHPFGFRDGERVVPAEVSDGETVTCPADGCDDQLHVRGPFTNGTVRHFYHPGSGGGGTHHEGGVGESAIHRFYKSHAASALLTFFGEFVEEATTREIFERRVSIPDTGRYRQADALVTFETPHSTLGNGVIIEVQHANKNKDIDGTTEDYLAAGYSVYWTDSGIHYDPGGYLFDRAQLDSEITSVWPDAVPDSDEWYIPFYEFPKKEDCGRAGLATFTHEFETEPQPPRRIKLPDEWYRDVIPAFWHWQLDKHPARLPDASEWEANAQAKARARNAAEDDNLVATSNPTYRLYRDLIADVRDDCGPIPARTVQLPREIPLDEQRELEYRHGGWASSTETDEHLATLRDLCESPRARVQLPPEYYEWLEQDCRQIHEICMDASSADVDLLYILSEYNAERRCGACGERAGYYVFTDSVVSVFACKEHLTDALVDARPSPATEEVV